MQKSARGLQIVELQSKPENIRNVTIIAHVDHGKTTLADSLVASNGIISERQAGKVRYLDRREDEQERGITMEAHACSLIASLGNSADHNYLINLIDSPGHVDFSADVSSAVRLCDGALLVVDVVEGVCVQTHAVLRTAWEEGLKPVLVLNKIDRLCCELKLTIEEANMHLHRIVEQANAVMAGLIRLESAISQSNIEALEEELLFAPEKGNVTFASGTDSWGFQLSDFIKLIQKKTNCNSEEMILSGLWGVDKYWDSKTNQVVTGSSVQHGPPMFAYFVLQSIWNLYDTVFADPPKPKKMVNILEAMNLSHLVPTVQQTKDKKFIIRCIMNAWLPCSKALFRMIVNCVPNPMQAQKKRARHLVPRLTPNTPNVIEDNLLNDELATKTSDNIANTLTTEIIEDTQRAIERCDPNGPLIAFVSKMLAVPTSSLPHTAQRTLESTQLLPSSSNDNKNCSFLAFGRIFSGTIRSGDRIYVIGPKNTVEVVPVNVVQPLLMMGGDFIELPEGVPCGNIFALSGLGAAVLKTATLCDVVPCPSLLKMPTQSAALLRVSIEPNDPRDWEKLAKGLKLLNRADPVLEVYISPNGELIVCAIGELHLERCLKDLKEVFAKVEFKVSEPLVAFRETIITKHHAHQSFWSNITPTPSQVFESFAKDEQYVAPRGEQVVGVRPILVVRCLPFTPEEDLLELENRQSIRKLKLENEQNFKLLSWTTNGNVLISQKQLVDTSSSSVLHDAMISGFHLACRNGPICDEPIRGVVFVVESNFHKQHEEEEEVGNSFEGGAIVASIADAFKRGMRCYLSDNKNGTQLPYSLRLVEAIFKCSLQCLMEGEQLGNLYSVLSKRRGRIVSEGLVDGTNIFQIEALIPVIESYKIADELRKKTSGTASFPQLVFSHWEVIDIDPFFKKTTEDELEAEGETVENDRNNNLAYKYMILVRKRKGIPTGEKVVEHADKERTLNKKR